MIGNRDYGVWSAIPDSHFPGSKIASCAEKGGYVQQCRAGDPRGAVYAASVYRNRLEAIQALLRMSGKRSAYDNAVAESSFSSLKNELCTVTSQPGSRSDGDLRLHWVLLQSLAPEPNTGLSHTEEVEGE